MDITPRDEGPIVPEDRQWLVGIHGTELNYSITVDPTLFTALTHYPNGYIPSGTVLAKADNGLYGPYSGQAAEVQSVTITGSPTGGNFTLTFGGETTANIPWNATAAQVRAALEGLAGVSSGDVTVTGGPAPGTAFAVTFVGTKYGNQAQMTASAAGLTGGTSPAVNVATTTQGGTAAVGGLDVPKGHLYNSIDLSKAPTSRKMTALFVHGAIQIAKLPANSGYDAVVAAKLPLISYR